MAIRSIRTSSGTRRRSACRWPPYIRARSARLANRMNLDRRSKCRSLTASRNAPPNSSRQRTRKDGESAIRSPQDRAATASFRGSEPVVEARMLEHFHQVEVARQDVGFFAERADFTRSRKAAEVANGLSSSVFQRSRSCDVVVEDESRYPALKIEGNP